MTTETETIEIPTDEKIEKIDREFDQYTTPRGFTIIPRTVLRSLLAQRAVALATAQNERAERESTHAQLLACNTALGAYPDLPGQSVPERVAALVVKCQTLEAGALTASTRDALAEIDRVLPNPPSLPPFPTTADGIIGKLCWHLKTERVGREELQHALDDAWDALDDLVGEGDDMDSDATVASRIRALTFPKPIEADDAMRARLKASTPDRPNTHHLIDMLAGEQLDAFALAIGLRSRFGARS